MAFDKTVFKLNDQEQFIIKTTDPIENLHCCSAVPVTFETAKTQYIVSDWNTYEEIRRFNKILNEALNNALYLDKLIIEDIGYFYNQEEHQGINSVYNTLSPYWAWSTPSNTRTWIYNDQEENIILELTPAYPWFDFDPEEHPEKKKAFIPYAEWIKTYKPYVVRTIPRDVAEQWLKQTQYILKHINANLRRMGEEYLANNPK